MKQFIFICLTLVVGHWANAQQDSAIIQQDSVSKVQYTPDFKFKDGVYLTFKDVRANHPIPKERIVTNADPKRFDFFEKILESNKISLYDFVGDLVSIKVKDIWGFAHNGVLYIQLHDEFNRIPIVGSISHFVANFTEVHQAYNPSRYSGYGNYNSYNNGRYGNNLPNNTYTTREMRQYILDFNTGEIREYSREAVSVCLMQDPELHDEYAHLSSRKQEKKKFLYIRKYNQRNPLYLPTN